VDDSQDGANTATTIASNSVGFAGLAAITYSSQVTSLLVYTGNGTDTIQVNSTSAATPLTLVTGTGSSTVTIGSPNGQGRRSLASIAGAINVQANASGKTTLTVDDSAEAGRAINLTANDVTFSGLPTITFLSLSALNVVAGTQAPPITVASVSGTYPVTIYDALASQVSGAAASQVSVSSSLPS
jgi:hypothetical protein